ncbi:MAG: DNA repair protein RecO [Patescibacteria group bacterium]|nr:DNA repair protein RecO [Patescibacteria group bacterium]MDD4610497.1 DNA repair protein RecO [Patescibacteria group bacterium]
MDETYRLNAIILKREDFRENDSRVIVFSKEKGKLELVARGAKKIKSKLAGHLEPLNLVEIMAVRGKQFDYAGTALSEECFSILKNDWEKINISLKAVKIFNGLIKVEEESGAENLFFLLKKYLEITDKTKENPALFFYIFLLKLLVELGYRPEVDKCVVCGKETAEGYFSSSRGGVICQKCLASCERQAEKVSDELIKNLKLIIENDMKIFLDKKFDEKWFLDLKNIISNYYQYITGGKI